MSPFPTKICPQSAFNFGQGFGVVETAANVLGIRTQIVLPKALKR
jgi:hypothetical protein